MSNKTTSISFGLPRTPATPNAADLPSARREPPEGSQPGLQGFLYRHAQELSRQRRVVGKADDDPSPPRVKRDKPSAQKKKRIRHGRDIDLAHWRAANRASVAPRCRPITSARPHEKSIALAAR